MTDQEIYGEPLSPQEEALLEAGKELFKDSLTIARDFCKTMMNFSIGAIPIYLGILVFLFPENYTLTALEGFLAALPAILFL